MKHLAIALVLAVPLAASAAGFAPLTMSDPGETCYSWEGGHGSAGSFSKCSPSVVIVAAAPAPAPVVESKVCPPQITVIPEPQQHKHRPIIKKKPVLKCS